MILCPFSQLIQRPRNLEMDALPQQRNAVRRNQNPPRPRFGPPQNAHEHFSLNRCHPVARIRSLHPVANHIGPAQIPLKAEVNPVPHLLDAGRTPGGRPGLERGLDGRLPDVHGRKVVGRCVPGEKAIAVEPSHGDFETGVPETAAHGQLRRQKNGKGWELL